MGNHDSYFPLLKSDLTVSPPDVQIADTHRHASQNAQLHTHQKCRCDIKDDRDWSRFHNPPFTDVLRSNCKLPPSFCSCYLLRCPRLNCVWTNWPLMLWPHGIVGKTSRWGLWRCIDEPEGSWCRRCGLAAGAVNTNSTGLHQVMLKCTNLLFPSSSASLPRIHPNPTFSFTPYS